MLLAVLYGFNPESHGFYPRCPLFVLTGWKCAGCGTLRALHCMLRGDLARAFAFNPLFVLSVPVLLVLAVKREWRQNRYVGWGALAVFFVYSICRNF
ncbi:MAG: DUF2752 domain-containing protein [Kiritimatiellaeota bacterium]|nr:DUF2752 domain-containing protein [Kiritimatiellota bacterium]